MNKTTLFATACALMFAAPVVAADSYGGFFLPPGNPVTGVFGGVTELVTPCDPGSVLQGVDGFWFDVSHESPGAPYTLSVDPTLDGDVWFFDAGCNYIPDGSGAAGLIGEPEAGVMAANTAWIIVDNFVGFGGFTLDIQ